MTAWTEHVKAYSVRKGISYKEGLKDPECKSSYHSKKTEQKAVDKGNKKFKEHQATKNLIMVGTPSISVPDKMVLITSKGEEKVIHPLTKKGTLARKDKQNIIQFKTNETNSVKVVDEGHSRIKRQRGLNVERGNKLMYAQNDYLETKQEGNKIQREINRIENLTRKTSAHATKLEELKKQLSELRDLQNKHDRKTDMYDGEDVYKRYNHKIINNI